MLLTFEVIGKNPPLDIQQGHWCQWLLICDAEVANCARNPYQPLGEPWLRRTDIEV